MIDINVNLLKEEGTTFLGRFKYRNRRMNICIDKP